MFYKILIFCLIFTLSSINAKVYNRCKLARDLKNKYHFPQDQISRWICIVHYESNFNTAAFNSVTKDYGLFQISQYYWCNPSIKTAHGGCNTDCSKFQDDNINDDVKCIKKIFAEFQKRTGNGFKAWTTYKAHCKGDTSRYTSKCKGL